MTEKPLITLTEEHVGRSVRVLHTNGKEAVRIVKKICTGYFIASDVEEGLSTFILCFDQILEIL